MTADKRNQRLQAARVGARVELRDLRLRRIEAELHQPASEGPFNFTLEVKPSVTRVDKLAAYTLEYSFSANDSEGQLVVDGSIEFIALYELPADDELTDDELTDDELAAFGRVSVLFAAHPYIREMLHSLTGRMGLPPLVLDVMRSPLDREDPTGGDSP